MIRLRDTRHGHRKKVSKKSLTCVILGLLEVKILRQAKGPGIRDIHSIQEGQEVHDADEGQYVPVDAVLELPLRRVRWTLHDVVIAIRVCESRMIGIVGRYDAVFPSLLVDTRASYLYWCLSAFGLVAFPYAFCGCYSRVTLREMFR